MHRHPKSCVFGSSNCVDMLLLQGQTAALRKGVSPKSYKINSAHISLYTDMRKYGACAIQAALGLAIGIKGVVRKRRMLYMIGQTRVHLDQVEGLGDFMELEVQIWLDLLTCA